MSGDFGEAVPGGAAGAAAEPLGALVAALGAGEEGAGGLGAGGRHRSDYGPDVKGGTTVGWHSSTKSGVQAGIGSIDAKPGVNQRSFRVWKWIEFRGSQL